MTAPADRLALAETRLLIFDETLDLLRAVGIPISPRTAFLLAGRRIKLAERLDGAAMGVAAETARAAAERAREGVETARDSGAPPFTPALEARICDIAVRVVVAASRVQAELAANHHRDLLRVAEPELRAFLGEEREARPAAVGRSGPDVFSPGSATDAPPPARNARDGEDHAE